MKGREKVRGTYSSQRNAIRQPLEISKQTESLLPL